jgi:S1-C subfamily serine protease
MASSVLETLSNDFAAAAEAAGAAVVAVYGRRWMPSSGIQWRKGVIVTADHTIRREEEITVVGEGGKSLKAKLAGRDPSTDLAILKLADEAASPLPQLGEAASVKLGQLVLALGRSRSANLVASAGIIGGVSGEWEPRHGGRLEQHIRLSLELYPGFSGGPLVNAQSKVVGINTRGLSRGRAVTIPLTTVTRVVDELVQKGHIARPYLGLAMQPVVLPESLRRKTERPINSAVLVVHVEPDGPADKAGILLGDVVVDFQGKAVEDTEDLQHMLTGMKVGDTVQVAVWRAGVSQKLSIVLTDRPAR